MPSIDLLISSDVVQSARIKQLSGMFDVPPKEKLTHCWVGEVPLDARAWNVGLIVGPSGAGKSLLAHKLFGDPQEFRWPAGSVIDDFPAERGIEEIAAACSAVGFNSIPSWMKPFAVLSNGEKFRVDLARRLIECADPIVVDEFTSVVDRQVAKIAAHAVQKLVRRRSRRFVAVACHYDIVDWLQPDWILEPATMTFQWRSVQRRPAIAGEIARVGHATWRLFAPHHYMSAELHRAAACFALFLVGLPVAFCAILHRPHPRIANLKGVSRLVTLPDFQGLGLAFALVETVAAAYRALGFAVNMYPAHPSLVRSFDRSPRWRLCKRPGTFAAVNRSRGAVGRMGGRPNAVFAYAGAPLDRAVAEALVSGTSSSSMAARTAASE